MGKYTVDWSEIDKALALNPPQSPKHLTEAEAEAAAADALRREQHLSDSVALCPAPAPASASFPVPDNHTNRTDSEEKGKHSAPLNNDTICLVLEGGGDRGDFEDGVVADGEELDPSVVGDLVADYPEQPFAFASTHSSDGEEEKSKKLRTAIEAANACLEQLQQENEALQEQVASLKAEREKAARLKLLEQIRGFQREAEVGLQERNRRLKAERETANAAHLSSQQQEGTNSDGSASQGPADHATVQLGSATASDVVKQEMASLQVVINDLSSIKHNETKVEKRARAVKVKRAQAVLDSVEKAYKATYYDFNNDDTMVSVLKDTVTLITTKQPTSGTLTKYKGLANEVQGKPLLSRIAGCMLMLLGAVTVGFAIAGMFITFGQSGHGIHFGATAAAKGWEIAGGGVGVLGSGAATRRRGLSRSMHSLWRVKHEERKKKMGKNKVSYYPRRPSTASGAACCASEAQQV